MVFYSYMKIVQKDAMSVRLTDCLMLSIKRKGKKKAETPTGVLCFFI